MSVYYRFGTEVARVGMTLFARVDRQGKENVPTRGPLILVSNHMGSSDLPLITTTVRRYVFFMAKRSLFKGLVGTAVLQGLGAFPLNRDGHDPEAIRWALRQLARDRCVGIFPEGSRSPHGPMKRASPGIAYLALKSQAPILPIAVWGTEKNQPLWRTVFPFGHMSVHVGPLFSLPVVEGNVTRPVLDHLTDTIMTRIAVMLPERYRGYYSLRRAEQEKAAQTPA